MFVNFIQLDDRFTGGVTSCIPSNIIVSADIVVPTGTYIPLRRRQDSWGVGVIRLYSILCQIH